MTTISGWNRPQTSIVAPRQAYFTKFLRFFFIFPFKQAKVSVLREIFISNCKIDFFLVLRSLSKSVCLSVCLSVCQSIFKQSSFRLRDSSARFFLNMRLYVFVLRLTGKQFTERQTKKPYKTRKTDRKKKKKKKKKRRRRRRQKEDKRPAGMLKREATNLGTRQLKEDKHKKKKRKRWNSKRAKRR